MLGVCVGRTGSADPAMRQGEAVPSRPPRYSALATELIETYAFPAPSTDGLQPAVQLPPLLSGRHLGADYRVAWEELLLELVATPVRDARVARMADRIAAAFARREDPLSVPALARAFALTVKQGVDQAKAIHRQKDILQALVATCDAKALQAILRSLELADARYGSDKPIRVPCGRTLREHVLYLMTQPDNPGKSYYQCRLLEKARKWQSIARAHQEAKSSAKNRSFLRAVGGSTPGAGTVAPGPLKARPKTAPPGLLELEQAPGH